MKNQITEIIIKYDHNFFKFPLILPHNKRVSMQNGASCSVIFPELHKRTVQFYVSLSSSIIWGHLAYNFDLTWSTIKESKYLLCWICLIQSIIWENVGWPSCFENNCIFRVWIFHDFRNSWMHNVLE